LNSANTITTAAVIAATCAKRDITRIQVSENSMSTPNA
jgi:hypothetical protein